MLSLARVYSRALVGVEAPLVTVETHISNGLPGGSVKNVSHFFLGGNPGSRLSH